MRGWTELLDGEEETPFPRASTRITKKREGSTYPSGPTRSISCFELPVNDVGHSTTLDLSSFNFPNVW